MPRGIKQTTEGFITQARALWGDKFDYSKTVYLGNNVPTKIGCPIHGDVEVEPRFHVTSKTSVGCPQCAFEEGSRKRAEARVKKYAEKFVARATAVHGDLYEYSKVNYKGQSEKVIIICKEHGEFLQNPLEHLDGNGCQKCARERIRQANRKPFEVFVKEANSVHNSKYKYFEDTYRGANTPTKVECQKHGEFWCNPSNHTDKLSGCPKCSNPVSKIETLVRSWFEWSEFSNRKILNGKELDMVNETLKIAVEVNGVYWHSETCGKGPSYHIRKTEQCELAGYKLMQFYDVEIYNKSEIVKSMIGSKFGLSNRLYARKCKVEKIDYSEAKTFLEANHLNGTSVASVCYGLKLDDVLLSVMTFAKPRFSDFEWEMIRFATKINTTVVGGASKLFKHFVKEHTPKEVVTYANRRYSKGKVYEALGFEFSHNSRPNYDYYKSSSRISRYAAQKHKLPKLLGDKFDKTKSESENMVASGFNKVYDCGNSVYIWRTKCSNLKPTCTTPKTVL